jgi:hypothetical protein
VGFKSSGLTEQQYRTAKKQLTKWAFAEFKTVGKLTDSGTVARLMDSSVYDINMVGDNGKVTEEQRKANGKVTTNKERKKDNKEKNKDITATLSEFSEDIFNQWWMILPSGRKQAKNKCLPKWKKLTSKKSDDEIIRMAQGIANYLEHHAKENTPFNFIKQPIKMLNDEIWNDE